ncbi:MAG TPA: Crp/Fnr family transcriptional regulator [Gemmatimonadaceae bacterium]|nr:Crp/Fnr family transcriptional regulator [Gemmatimonadaceae bacterium]
MGFAPKQKGRPVHYETARLTAEQMAVASGYGARATWPAGFDIYQRGTEAEGLFVVLKGRVILRTRVKAGRGFIPGVAMAGGTFGGEGLAATSRASATYVTDAKADDESETLYLNGVRFREFVREHPPQAFALVGQVMAEYATLLDKMRELATLSVEQRLVAVLSRLGRQKMFMDTDGQIILDVAQNRVLCELVGATRESVSLVIAKLVSDGLAERINGTIVIPSVSDLIARSQESPRIIGDIVKEPHRPVPAA